ncbi:MAG: hypothetical protein DRO36_07380 [Candidatus Hecatellales archaeon]|nr:MAG: hypothetical protein DRO36_07380 [Candidatus Hecatellales archaeon]
MSVTEKIVQVIPVKSRKEPKIYRGPSKRGPCRVCGESGIRRYMIACDLPEPMELCDRCYKMIRAELKACLLNILEKHGLIPKEILEAGIGPYRVKIEKEPVKEHGA